MGAEIAKYRFLQEQAVYTKFDTSVATATDIAAENAIREFLSLRFSSIGFEGEETGVILGAVDLRWRVDPIDGTDNYVVGIPVFSTSVALVSKEKCLCGAIVNPITNQVFTVDQTSGARINGEPLSAKAPGDRRHKRVAFIPDYSSKQNAFVKLLLEALRGSVFRVIDSWAPALDWCSLASGRFDAILQVASSPAVPNVGYLLAREAGAILKEITIERSDLAHLHLIVAATTDAGCSELEELINTSMDKV